MMKSGSRRLLKAVLDERVDHLGSQDPVDVLKPATVRLAVRLLEPAGVGPVAVLDMVRYLVSHDDSDALLLIGDRDVSNDRVAGVGLVLPELPVATATPSIPHIDGDLVAATVASLVARLDVDHEGRLK